MHKLSRLIPMAGAAGLLGATMLLAQGPGGRSFGPGFGPGFGGPRGLTFLTTVLDLTSTQVTQAQAIFSSERTASQPILQQLRTERQAVEEAIQAGQSAAQLTTLTAAEGPLDAQLAANRAIAQAQFWALLNPAQQQKLVAMQQAHQPPANAPGSPSPSTTPQ